MRIAPLTSGKLIPFLNGKNKEVKDVIVVKTLPTTKGCQPIKPNTLTKYNEKDENGNPIASGTTVTMTKYDDNGNILSVVEATRIDYFA